jgi:hypothetical protein
MGVDFLRNQATGTEKQGEKYGLGAGQAEPHRLTVYKHLQTRQP